MTEQEIQMLSLSAAANVTPVLVATRRRILTDFQAAFEIRLSDTQIERLVNWVGNDEINLLPNFDRQIVSKIRTVFHFDMPYIPYKSTAIKSISATILPERLDINVVYNTGLPVTTTRNEMHFRKWGYRQIVRLNKDRMDSGAVATAHDVTFEGARARIDRNVKSKGGKDVAALTKRLIAEAEEENLATYGKPVGCTP